MTEPGMSRFVSQDSTRRASILNVVAGLSLFTLLALFGLAAPAEGQLYAGSITGVVSDQTGAMIPGAEVTLTDADKGYTFVAKTDDKGRYLFRSVAPGLYNLTVKAAGFKDQAKERDESRCQSERRRGRGDDDSGHDGDYDCLDGCSLAWY